MLFAEVAAASVAMAATTRRSAKVATLSDLLARLEPSDVPVAVSLLTGEPRQGRIGVGWATLAGVGEIAAAPEPSLSIGEVDAVLDELATTTGSTSQGRRRELLASLLGRATAEEADLLRRLLTGELRQGALDGVMTEAIAKAAGVPTDAVRRAAMFSGDLGVAAVAALADGDVDGLSAFGIEVGRFLQPMLAASSPDVASALGEIGPASVEWKLDGARIQVHRSGDDVRVFTRNGNDVTDRLPGVRAVTGQLAGHALVLDGEALGVDDEGRPHRFQDTMSRFGTETVPLPAPHGAIGLDLRAYFFDVLHADGEDLVDAPLARRQEVLDSIAGPARIPAVAVQPDEVERAVAFANDAVGRGHEGVMVKALDAPYLAGRRGGAWRKVKPVRTLDLVVLAAEWGHGRRTGWLSNLHLGARDPSGGFVMVGKTFKGLTDELLTWQTERLRSMAVAEHGHVVHVRPELVVEIALDGVQASTRYPGGVALRFARVRGYRPDRSPTDADTIDTVRAML